jgi:hypothetical protein
VLRWLPEMRRAARPVTWGLDARDLAWPDSGDDCASAPHAQALPRAITRLPSGSSVNVIAGHDLAVHWLQSPPDSLASLQELRLVAAARCAHLYGGSPQDWWIAGDWSATRPFVCAALPRAVTARLQQTLEAAAVSVRWHTAWSVACGARTNTFPSLGWSAVRTPHQVVLWHCNEGQINCLTSHSVSPGTTDAVAAEQTAQLAKLEAVRDASLSDGLLRWETLCSLDESNGSEARAARQLASMLEGVA